MTLLPGDFIITGTPSGVGPIVPGDLVDIEIEGVGMLTNPGRRRDLTAPSRIARHASLPSRC